MTADRLARLRALLSVGTPGEIKNAAPSILTALDAAEALASAVVPVLKWADPGQIPNVVEARRALDAFRAAMEGT